VIPIVRPSLPPLKEYVTLLERIWETRMLSNFSEFSQLIEVQTATYLEVPETRGVVSCDIGLIVTLKALGLPHGAPCFVSDFTFNSTANAALWAGLRPVFVDVDRFTFNMSHESLAEAMRHEPPGLVLATHVFGNPCDVEALKLEADTHGSRLVFDAAHAYGSMRGGTKVGGLGDAEVFSFSGTKLVTMAEGGLVATHDAELAERITFIRAYGFQGDYISCFVGLNGKLSELHAALGTLELDLIEPLLERRLALLARYRERLGDQVGWQQVRDTDRSTFKDLALDLQTSERRSAVQTALTDAGIQSKRYFVPLHTMPAFEPFAKSRGYPNTSDLHVKLLCVPLFPDLTFENVDNICNVILKALGEV
jgi:dTDP-4-amino-4,6-dideoxygalactose transaminase